MGMLFLGLFCYISWFYARDSSPQSRLDSHEIVESCNYV
jgi:hypothetical protein